MAKRYFKLKQHESELRIRTDGNKINFKIPKAGTIRERGRQDRGSGLEGGTSEVVAPGERAGPARSRLRARGRDQRGLGSGREG